MDGKGVSPTGKGLHEKLGEAKTHSKQLLLVPAVVDHVVYYLYYT